MKRILLSLITMLVMTHSANAVWQGKLDLQPSVFPLVLREAHDGQWLAGLSVPNLFHLDHNGNMILHTGLFQAWNTEHANASFGPLMGLNLGGVSKDLGLDVPARIGEIGSGIGLGSVFKPIALLSSALSLDAFAGYRPVHTVDVNGEFVYGGAATLGIPFGSQELKSGL